MLLGRFLVGILLKGILDAYIVSVGGIIVEC